MKKLYSLPIFLLAFILLSSSCSDIESIENIDNQENFTIDASEVQNLTNNQFLMATDPTDGELLYWETGLSFEDNITFDAKSETVDITSGVEYSSGFYIRTYREVKSSFKLSGFIFQCNEGQNTINPLGLSNVELHIAGTREIEELYNPLYKQYDLSVLDSTNFEIKNNIIYDYANDVTIIKGIFNYTFEDLQIAMRFFGDPNLKSLILKDDDWVQIDSDIHMIEVQEEDFSSCTVHQIDIGKEAGWLVNAEALTTTGDRVALANWSNYAQTQNSDHIMVVVDDRIQLQDVWLSISSNNYKEGDHFQKKYTNIPTTIALEDLEPEIGESTNSSYYITAPSTADLIRASYQYNNDNRIFTWEIYQTTSSSNNYNLPEIQAEYLDETDLMKQVLPTPESLIVETYNLEENLDHIYHQTNIDRQLPCLGYNSTYGSLEF